MIKATIHSRLRGLATAAFLSGLHMATIYIAMRHLRGVTLHYVALTIVDRAEYPNRYLLKALAS